MTRVYVGWRQIRIQIVVRDHRRHYFICPNMHNARDTTGARRRAISSRVKLNTNAQMIWDLWITLSSKLDL